MNILSKTRAHTRTHTHTHWMSTSTTHVTVKRYMTTLLMCKVNTEIGILKVPVNCHSKGTPTEAYDTNHYLIATMT